MNLMIRIYLFLFISNAYFAPCQNLLFNCDFDTVIPISKSAHCDNIFTVDSFVLTSWSLITPLHEKKISSVKYFTDLDKSYYINNKLFYNWEVMFANKFSFVDLKTSSYRDILLQQKLKKPLNKGLYCLSYSYKPIKSKGFPLTFILSQEDLKNKFKNNHYTNLSQSDLIAVLKDTSDSFGKSIPWKCGSTILNSNGGEEYFSFGSVSQNLHNGGLAIKGYYFINRIELFEIKDSSYCFCKKDSISLNPNPEFKPNKLLLSDSLFIYSPQNIYYPEILFPSTIDFLKRISNYYVMKNGVKIEITIFTNNINSVSGRTAISSFLSYYNVKKQDIVFKNDDLSKSGFDDNGNPGIVRFAIKLLE